MKSIEQELEKKIMQKYAKMRSESRDPKVTPRNKQQETENNGICFEYIDDEF